MMVSNKNTKKKTVIKTLIFFLLFIVIVGGFGILYSVLVGYENARFEKGLRDGVNAAISASAVSGSIQTSDQ